MKLGTEDKKKLGILAVAGVGALAAVGYMASQLFPSTSSVPPPAVANLPAGPVAATPAPASRSIAAAESHDRPLGTTAAALDPTLHMQGMLAAESLQYHGSGRNIFSAGSEPAAVATRIPKPIASARPAANQVAAAAVPAGPPPIDLRFFGTASRPNSTAAPRAFLLRGDEVYLATVGDVVQRRYKVVAITANSLTVQDLADNHQQTLPLATN